MIKGCGPLSCRLKICKNIRSCVRSEHQSLQLKSSTPSQTQVITHLSEDPSCHLSARTKAFPPHFMIIIIIFWRQFFLMSVIQWRLTHTFQCKCCKWRLWRSRFNGDIKWPSDHLLATSRARYHSCEAPLIGSSRGKFSAIGLRALQPPDAHRPLLPTTGHYNETNIPSNYKLSINFGQLLL